jgi:hypothetical protein
MGMKDNEYKMAWIELKECLNNNARALESIATTDRLKGKLEGVKLAIGKLEQTERSFNN